MSRSGDRGIGYHLIVAFIASGAFTFCSMATATGTAATEAVAPEPLPAPENSLPGPVGLGVSGSSAGITTDYMEQAVTEALVASGIFSGVDSSKAADTTMRMLRVKGVFPGTTETANTPYFLNVRVIHVDTPSFSVRMTVGMRVAWTLYRVADKTELLNEIIESTYTGGMFEGGIHGANRVRVAMEGSMRENVRIGMGMLGSVDLDREMEPMASGQDSGLLESGPAQEQ